MIVKRLFLVLVNHIYNKTDLASMRSLLAPVFANTILTEFKKCVVQKLTSSGMIKF